MTTIVAVWLPGLAHRMSEHPVGPALASLLACFEGATLEGERVVGEGTVELALALAGERFAGLGAACAVGHGVVERLDQVVLGREAHLARRLVARARVGEVLVTPAVGDIPDGVGVFQAPDVLTQELGCVIRVLKDYRGL